ncbi:TetR/AcrR family transcriptional regulator [Clostridium sp. CTA-5]
MPRVTKEREERRNELIDTAEELFKTIGYNKTAVSDIVKKISVAQGTFYYYFKSKEDIFLAVFNRYILDSVSEINEILNNNINSIEKFKQVLAVQLKTIKSQFSLSSQLQDEENSGIHQKAIIDTIKVYSPIYSILIKQGINEGTFKTEYPDEVAQFFMVIINFLFDLGIFKLTLDEYIQKVKALCNIMDKILELPQGSFKFPSIISKPLD